ncbi:MAG: hypothetical protein K0S54_1133 [Alphaproteobacteria bacterium]|jgi:hypothetical protein|nr:hypothetical protein [Alphaproteobacteria bacterium]
MKDLSEFLKSMNPYAPGLAEPTAFFGIRQAAIEFCERTRLWRHEDEFEVSAQDAEAIIAPYGAVLMDIESVFFDGQKVEPKTTAWLDEHVPGWRVGEVEGEPRYLTQIDLNTMRLIPGKAGNVRISMWLKPSQDCDEVPDFLADQYRETIAQGALARILVMRDKPYTDRELAAVCASSFEAKLVSLQHSGSSGQQRARTRTKPNYF